MGKIDDNGTMRDPSSEESTQIGQKIKGGISPEYELIKTIDVSQLSEPVSMITVSKDEDDSNFAYDDIIVDFTNAKASADNSKLQTFILNNGSKFFSISRSNYLGTNAKNIYETFIRENETLWNLLITGGYQYQSGGKINLNSYTDKITQVGVVTDSTFTEGILKIYGRKKY